MEVETSLAKETGLENIDIVRVMLVKESVNPYKKKRLRTTTDAMKIAKDFLTGQDREIFITINIDNSKQINSINVVSMGTLNNTIIHPREIFKSAILSNADSIILAHNHPSGNPEPSYEDSQITCRLFECGDLLDIKVLDHIILGDGKYSHCIKFENGKKKEICWATDEIL